MTFAKSRYVGESWTQRRSQYGTFAFTGPYMHMPVSRLERCTQSTRGVVGFLFGCVACQKTCPFQLLAVGMNLLTLARQRALRCALPIDGYSRLEQEGTRSMTGSLVRSMLFFCCGVHFRHDQALTIGTCEFRLQYRDMEVKHVQVMMNNDTVLAR